MDALTFVFLLTTWSPETPHATVDVMDHNLTGSDCVAAAVAYHAADPQWTAGVPSCEIDTGDWAPHPYDSFAVCATDACPNPIILDPCQFEDSDNCFWDSRFMGNGIGESFYVIDGEKTVIDWEK